MKQIWVGVGFLCLGCGDTPRESAVWSPPEGTFKQLSAGKSHTCGVRTDDTAECWGVSSDGRLAAPGGAVRGVGVGGEPSCVIRADGSVRCWNPVYNPPLLPPADVAALSDIRAVDLDQNVACALSGSGRATCLPSYHWDQAPSEDLTDLSVAWSAACGVTRAGDIRCWAGSCALSSAQVRECFPLATSKLSQLPPGPFQQVSVADGDACALRKDGTLVCWGDSKVAGMHEAPSGSFTQVSHSDTHACALRSDGTLACWPGAEGVPEGKFKQVSAAERHDCAIREDGRVVCWAYGE